jgi:hypothetical protein
MKRTCVRSGHRLPPAARQEFKRLILANSNDALPKPEVALGEPVADLVAPTVAAGAVQCVPEPVPLGKSVPYCELRFCCVIRGVAGTISRCCCRSPIAC